MIDNILPSINYPLLLDGGLSNELESQGHDLNHHLWSARMLVENPEALTKAHLAYLNAGADCIITSSYQATIQGFMSMGLSKSASINALLKSVQVAQEAVSRYLSSDHFRGNHPLIAASIGPYGAYLADGSEYRGHYGVSDAILKDFHQSRITVLDQSGADCFACETIPSFQEAKVLADILQHTQKSAWVSFSCKDEQHINDGTPIKEAVALLSNHPKVFAIGVNCTAPKYISGLIKAIKTTSGNKKIVVYPNSGEVYHAESKQWSGFSDPNFCNLMTREWLNLGADMIGGCCRIGPAHIRAMKSNFGDKNS
jgi:homocysteine S-methyltransferase